MRDFATNWIAAARRFSSKSSATLALEAHHINLFRTNRFETFEFRGNPLIEALIFELRRNSNEE